MYVSFENSTKILGHGPKSCSVVSLLKFHPSKSVAIIKVGNLAISKWPPNVLAKLGILTITLLLINLGTYFWYLYPRNSMGALTILYSHNQVLKWVF